MGYAFFLSMLGDETSLKPARNTIQLTSSGGSSGAGVSNSSVLVSQTYKLTNLPPYQPTSLQTHIPNKLTNPVNFQTLQSRPG